MHYLSARFAVLVAVMTFSISGFLPIIITGISLRNSDESIYERASIAFAARIASLAMERCACFRSG